MDLCLNNKVIVVTSGIRSNVVDITRILTEEGAVLAIVGKNVQEVYQLLQESESQDRNVILVAAELNNEAECKNAIQTIIHKFGRIDGLVNYPDEYGDSVAGNRDSFLENLRNNLLNYFLVTHFALPYLVKNKGAIINISSEINEYVNDTAESAATGGGINALTREWAVELLKYGIRVNSIIMTGSDAEITHSVAFLLSEKSSHTTGQLIQVNNEYLIK